MREKELQIILEKHKKWLNEERDGERADFLGAMWRIYEQKGSLYVR